MRPLQNELPIDASPTIGCGDRSPSEIARWTPVIKTIGLTLD
jgi:hypothetical protein